MEKNTPASTALLRYALLTAVAATMVVVFYRIVRVNQTTVALILLVLILLTAYRWRLAYSIYLALLCTVVYNFFFLPPVGRLTIQDPQNWIALLVFLCAGALVSHLSNRERRHAEEAEARRRDVELLYELSQKLLIQDEVKELARTTPSIIASVFGFRAVALYVSSMDTTFYSDPNQILLSTAELRTLRGNTQDGITVESGLLIMDLRLGVQHDLGRLAVALDGERFELSGAIRSLVSVALERAATLERTSRLEAARESERLRTALVDSIAHDLRTPLTAIRAAASTLLAHEKMEGAERNDLIAVVEEESQRLDKLIGQALEMAKLDSNVVNVELAPQDVRELVEMTLEQAQSTLRSHQVEVTLPPGMPPVRMDRTLIQRVLLHLLENAAKYSPPGEEIAITGGIEASRLVFTVSDRGPGIDPNDLPFVFEKYFRGKRQKNGVKGTGMGLAIVRAILRAHGGDISVESQPEHGARFSFWIPITP